MAATLTDNRETEREKMWMTSPPERRLSFGMGNSFEFETGQNHWILGQVELGEIFTFKMEGNSFLQVRGNLIECSALCHHGKINTLRHVL